ncbi:unnamed protein product [Strongylus vulgaris]|uniref:Trehalase n=1 Tax=Strongylus vulgaris TaxID=40348 RepID=A0A3P7M303_STRVU|nr:unnamed protein product [Strongylus vulgaris]
MRTHCIINPFHQDGFTYRRVSGFGSRRQFVEESISSNAISVEVRFLWRHKYNVIGDYPRPGSGGEYDVQDGFGWTNGAILDLLVTYNHRLHV